MTNNFQPDLTNIFLFLAENTILLLCSLHGTVMFLTEYGPYLTVTGGFWASDVIVVLNLKLKARARQNRAASFLGPRKWLQENGVMS